MKEIVKRDYSKIAEFEREGYRYCKFKESEHFILWRVDRNVPEWREAWDKYELWKKKFVTNPDGSKVVRKMNDEDGGKGLWFFNSWMDFNWYVRRNPEKFGEEVLLFCRQ